MLQTTPTELQELVSAATAAAGGLTSRGAAEGVVRHTDALAAFLQRLEAVCTEREAAALAGCPGGVSIHAEVEQVTLSLLHAHLPELTSVLDASYAALTALDRQLAVPERRAASAYHRLRLHRFMLQSPFVRRLLDKPLGTIGDFVLEEQIFANLAGGDTAFGKLLSHYWLNIGAASAFRSRLPWALERLWALQRSLDRPLRVLSFACGSERLLRTFVAQGGEGQFTLCDADGRALQFCRRRFDWLGRRSGTTVPLKTRQVSVAMLLSDAKASAELRQLAGDEGYDVVSALGVLDYLHTDAAAAFLTRLVPLVRPGGTLLLSNMHASNPWRSAMEYVVDWQVIHRELPALHDLLAVSAPALTPAELTTDDTGASMFYAGVRG